MESQRIVQITYIGGAEQDTHILVRDKVSGEVLADRYEYHDHIYAAIEFFDEQYMMYGFGVEHGELERDSQGHLAMIMTVTK